MWNQTYNNSIPTFSSLLNWIVLNWIELNLLVFKLHWSFHIWASLFSLSSAAINLRRNWNSWRKIWIGGKNKWRHHWRNCFIIIINTIPKTEKFNLLLNWMSLLKLLRSFFSLSFFALFFFSFLGSYLNIDWLLFKVILNLIGITVLALL